MTVAVPRSMSVSVYGLLSEAQAMSDQAARSVDARVQEDAVVLSRRENT